MSPAIAGLVFVGGAIGGVLRVASMRVAVRRGIHATTALLLVNLSGCLVAGLVAATLIGDAELRRVAIGGVLGGFTTFSALSLDTTLGWRRGERVRPLLLACGTVAAAAPAAALGLWIGAAIRVAIAGGAP